MTTVHAALKTELTNGRVANWAPEITFSSFWALWLSHFDVALSSLNHSWISIGSWETDPPFPWPNFNINFTLRGKCMIRGAVGGQFSRILYYTDPHSQTSQKKVQEMCSSRKQWSSLTLGVPVWEVSWVLNLLENIGESKIGKINLL